MKTVSNLYVEASWPGISGCLRSSYHTTEKIPASGSPPYKPSGPNIGGVNSPSENTALIEVTLCSRIHFELNFMECIFCWTRGEPTGNAIN